MAGSNTVRSPHYGALQDVVDSLYLGLGPKEKLRRLDIVVAAEAADLPDDLAEIVNLLPPGSYTRQRLCDQLNSAIGGHAWGQVYGTVQERVGRGRSDRQGVGGAGAPVRREASPREAAADATSLGGRPPRRRP